MGKTFAVIFLLVAGLATIGYLEYRTGPQMEDPVLIKSGNSFDDFLSVNSVREHRENWITDQYRVADNHRIFAMSAQLFTGEEVIKGRWKNHFIIDKTVPHDEYPNDKMGFNPAKGAGGFNFDEFLFTMKRNRIKSIPVLRGNLLYANLENDSLVHREQLPWDEGGERDNPMDYKAFASFLYQFTARYGKNRLIEDGGSIPAELIKTDDKNARLAGLDLVEAIEPGNEMDRTWFTKRTQASPKELAAFMSAAIDGHMGQMGPGHGIRLADPDMKILLPGLIDIRPDYLLEFKRELLAMRKNAESLGYPVNPLQNFVINVHKYPMWDHPNRSPAGRPPVEFTDMYEKSVEFVEMVRSEFPGCEIYLSETGYDKVIAADTKRGIPTLESDPILDKGISPYAQARHLSRLSLSMYGTGFDRLYLFTLKDPKAIGAGFYRTQFSTSGLVRKNGDKDLAWYIVRGLRLKLTGYRLESYQVTDEHMHIMTFQKDGTRPIKAVWMGTNEGMEKVLQLDSPPEKVYYLKDADQKNWLDGMSFESTKFQVTEFPALIEYEDVQQ